MLRNSHRSIRSILALLTIMMALLSGCADAASEASPTAAPTPTEPAPPTRRVPPTVFIPPTATPAPTPTKNSVVPQFDGESALDYVVAQMDFGPRPTGTDAHRAVGDYILETLVAHGWTVEEQPFVYQGVEARNLIARTGEGDAPPIVLGAHYDTRRRADRDANNPEAPVPGANDGASGVAVLLELARVLDTSQLDGELWLVFFDAEDNGRLDDWEWIVGSRYFVENLSVIPQYAIIVDMIGDADQDIYYEINSNDPLQEHLWSIAASLGYADTIIPRYGHSMLDDHTPFLEQGIPAVDIIDFDYAYWHTTEDTTDKVSAESLARVGQTLEVFLEAGGQLPQSASD